MTTRKSTALRKTAITVPEDLLRSVDRVASRRGESRSGFINHVLMVAVRAARDADITERLNELFADPELAEQNSREGNALDREGTHWSDDRW